MTKADELRDALADLSVCEGQTTDDDRDIARAHNAGIECADIMDQMAEALRKIERRATPHPDDTPEDRKRDLFHVHAEAGRALRAAGYEVTK